METCVQQPEVSPATPDHRPQVERAFLARLKEVFDRLRGAGIEFCVLRNRDRIPSGLLSGSDVDLIVPSGTSIPLLISLLADLNPVHLVPHRSTLEVYLPAGGLCLHVDLLVNDREWRGARYLENRRILSDASDDDGIPVASPLHQAFCAWFSSLTRMGVFKPRYIPLITSVARQSTEPFACLLRDTFGPRLGGRLLELALSGTPEKSEPLAGTLRRTIWWRALCRRPLSTLGGFFRHYLPELRLMARPAGLVVAVLGPDGAGKSAVCSGLIDMSRAHLPFKSVEAQHLYQRALPRLSELRKGRLRRTPLTKTVTHDPHGKSPHGFIVSIFCIFYSVIDQWLSRIFWGRRKLAHNMLLLHDRHMMEVQVDPRRFRYAGPPRLPRLINRVIPRPDLMILLDAPADVLQSRKQEVAFEETERQRRAYRELVENGPHHRIVDASQPLDSVIAHSRQVILEHLAERTQRQHASAKGPKESFWLRKGSWAIADQTLISFTNFATMVLLARGLGPAAFGAFSLVYGGLLFANGFQSSLVTQPHGVLSATRQGRAYSDYTFSAFCSQLVLTLLAAVVALAIGTLGWLAGWGATHLLIALTPAIVAWQLQEFMRRVLYHETRFAAAFLNDVISYGGQTMAIALLWWYGLLTGPLALYALAGTSFAAALLGLWQLRASLAGSAKWSVVAENWKLGKWLAGAEMGYWLSSQMYLYLAGLLLGTAASGILKAAYTIFGPMRILGFFLKSILPNRFARTLASKGKAALARQLREVYWIAAPLVAAYCILVAVLARPLLDLLFGPGYDGQASVLMLYAICAFVAFMAQIVACALKAGQLTRRIFMSQTFASLVALPLGWIIIKLMGIEGAVIGMILTSLVVNFWNWRAYRRDLLGRGRHDETRTASAAAPQVALDT